MKDVNKRVKKLMFKNMSMFGQYYLKKYNKIEKRFILKQKKGQSVLFFDEKIPKKIKREEIFFFENLY